MRKFLLCLVTILLATNFLSVSVFADNYVPSIGIRKEVEVTGGGIKQTDDQGVEHSVTFTSKTIEVEDKITHEKHEVSGLVGTDPIDDCWVEIIVTPYPLKETIESSDSYNMINTAFDIVTTIPKIEELDPVEIKQAADKCDVDVDDLLVTDLFDITKYHRGLDKEEGPEDNDEKHEESWIHHGYVEVTLGLKSLKNFVCLLHYYDDQVDGGDNPSWHVVPSAYVLKDGEHLYLSVDELSPFAVVVHAEEGIGSRYDISDTGIDGPLETEKGKCFWHIFMLINTIFFFVLLQFVRAKDDDDSDSLKKIINKRKIITIISLIIDIILYLLGGCLLCTIAFVLEIIVAIGAYYYTNKCKKKNEE